MYGSVCVCVCVWGGGQESRLKEHAYRAVRRISRWFERRDRRVIGQTPAEVCEDFWLITLRFHVPLNNTELVITEALYPANLLVNTEKKTHKKHRKTEKNLGGHKSQKEI